HAGRGNPPFAHGIISVDRQLSLVSLLESAMSFYRHVMHAADTASSADAFYREYLRAVDESPQRVTDVLHRYVESFGDMPLPPRSTLQWDWVAEEGAQPKRVVIVHGDNEPFGVIAHTAAKLASLLYRSNIKWTSITSGRDVDIPGGVSIRIVRER